MKIIEVNAQTGEITERELTPEEIAEMEAVQVEMEAIPQLLILIPNGYLQDRSDAEIMNTDIDLLQGLSKTRQYSRGYLIRKKYELESDLGMLAILRDYNLVFENGLLVGENSVITWYYDNGEVAFVKNDFVSYSAKDSASRLREIRQTRIDYLQYPEPQYINPTVLQYITMLFEHYKAEVSDYILADSKAFENAILNETNATYLAILNAKLADGKTVKESILYQIQGDY